MFRIREFSYFKEGNFAMRGIGRKFISLCKIVCRAQFIGLVRVSQFLL